MRKYHPPRKYVKQSSVGLAALALLLTACGSSSTASSSSTTTAGSKTPTGDALLTYQGSNSTSVLEAAAKKEGKLNFMTSLAGPIVTKLTAAFEKEYPYIHVTVNRADESTLIPQAVSEIQAGKPAADVFEVTSPGALELRAAGILLPYADPNAGSVPSQYVAKSGSNYLLVTDRISWLSFGYNTKKIPAADVPKTLSDLTNPIFKGQLVTEATSTGWNWIGAVLYEMGKTKGEAFLKKLGANNKPAVVSLSGAATAGLVASGQYGASFSVFQDHFLENAAKGSPVKWIPLAPVIANVGQVGVLKKAADPAAAALFIRFETGSAAQKIFKALHYGSPSVPVTYKTWVPTQGVTTAKQYSSELSAWQALQKKYFG